MDNMKKHLKYLLTGLVGVTGIFTFAFLFSLYPIFLFIILGLILSYIIGVFMYNELFDEKD